MEIARQLTWSRQRAELYHYRTKDKGGSRHHPGEPSGQVVGIDVKAGATVRAEDFRGLRHLADRVGDDLIVGVIVYTGKETLPFGPRLRAIPISALWETSSAANEVR
jgi:predicted AAA+ superfamily ATPase